MRNYHSLRNAVTLGTSLTALFLLVRCSVPERDYSKLGIGENAGSGGGSGSGGDGIGATSAGDGGLGGQDRLDGMGGFGDLVDAGGEGGQPPVPPVPCVLVSTDAGTNDAGTDDAGTGDAGTHDANAACECVDGFFRGVDVDGDGERSRACSFAPGLDCDDSDPGVTHNSCGGCTALPHAIGEDCLDCGTYICDGPDAVICASKPGPVEDPDCRCQNGLIVARDTDGDGYGTRLCEANPGTDCDDGNGSFVSNACGGCEPAPGALGAACNQCGVYACNSTAIVCAPQTGAAGVRCLNDDKTRQTCVGTGFWGNDTTCGNVCYQGNCELCTPGTFECVPYGASTQLQICYYSSSYGVIVWGSYASCTPAQTCNPTAGQCQGLLLLPRDETFDVAPRLRNGLPWHDLLNTALDSDYG